MWRCRSTGISRACSPSLEGPPLERCAPEPVFEEATYMGLIVDPVLTFTPATIAKAGGTVVASFERRSTGAPSAEKTTYSISPGQPYVFANSSSSSNPKIIDAPRQEVTLNPADRRQTLVL